MITIARSILSLHGTDEVFARIDYSQDIFDVTRPPIPDINNPAAVSVPLQFRVQTYRELGINKDPNSWRSIFRSANEFMSRLSLQEQYVLYRFYADARRCLRELVPGNEMQTAEQISQLLVCVDLAIDLAHKLVTYVTQSDMPIPDLSAIGQRDHDTAQLTVYQDEYYVLMAVNVLCKLMCPIWGDYISRTAATDEMNKEVYCGVMLRQVFDTPVFRAMMQPYDGKFYFYHKNGVVRYLARRGKDPISSNLQAGMVLAQAGFSLERLVEWMLAVQLVRKMATFDCYFPNSNLMKYVSSSINMSCAALYAKLNKRSDTMPRLLDHGGDSRSDSDNISFIEGESRVSNRTADIPIMIELGIASEIPKLLTQYGLDSNTFQQCCQYYALNLFRLSPLSLAVLTALFSERIGGSIGIRFLSMPSIIQLTSLAQLHLIKRGDYQLAHLLTAHTTTDPKTVMFGTVGVNLEVYTTSRPAYRQLCEQVFRTPIDGRTIAIQIRSIIDWIRLYDHYLNIAPAAYHAMGGTEEMPEQRTLIEIDEDTGDHFCNFLLERYRLEEGTLT